MFPCNNNVNSCYNNHDGYAQNYDIDSKYGIYCHDSTYQSSDSSLTHSETINSTPTNSEQDYQTINSTLNGTYLTDQELPNQTFSSASNVFGDL